MCKSYVESEIFAGCFSTLTISFGTTFKSKLRLELDSAASLKEKGKLVVVIDTGVVTRGSGSQGTDREKEIRKNFVENDLIKAVILLTDNLFYNTTAPGNIIVINKAKKHKGEILLINSSKIRKGRPKSHSSKIITIEARKNDCLSPFRYVSVDE